MVVSAASDRIRLWVNWAGIVVAAAVVVAVAAVAFVAAGRPFGAWPCPRYAHCWCVAASLARNCVN